MINQQYQTQRDGQYYQKQGAVSIVQKQPQQPQPPPNMSYNGYVASASQGHISRGQELSQMDTASLMGVIISVLITVVVGIVVYFLRQEKVKEARHEEKTREKEIHHESLNKAISNEKDLKYHDMNEMHRANWEELKSEKEAQIEELQTTISRNTDVLTATSQSVQGLSESVNQLTEIIRQDNIRIIGAKKVV